MTLQQRGRSLTPTPEIDFGHLQAKFGLNMISIYGPFEAYVVNDDVYRRLLTWHFYKGDGKYASVEWLKRRIWRFCYGKNGTSPEDVVDPMVPVDQNPTTKRIAYSDQISITFGVKRNITIRFILGIRSHSWGAMCNTFGCNGFEPQIGKTPPWDIGFETKGGITLRSEERRVGTGCRSGR